MVTNLELINLYLAANILVALAFGGYAWLYFDLYSKENKKHAFQRALGGTILGVSFLLNLVLNVNDQNGLSVSVYTLGLQAIGLLLIVCGNTLEKVPGVPGSEEKKSKKKKSSRKKNRAAFLGPISTLFLAPANFVLGIVAAVQTNHKIKYGKSNEFKGLLYFWIAFSCYLALQALSVIGTEHLVWLDILTRQYAVLWIASQAVLLASFALMIRWISKFISFRASAQVFFGVWQLAVILSVILASAYSLFMISSAETQLMDLLRKNAKLVDFNLEQIQTNNEDLLEAVAENDEVAEAISSQDGVALQSKVEAFIDTNDSLDRVVVVNQSAILVYDSDDPEVQGESLSGNQVIKRAIWNREAETGYIVERVGASADRLILQSSYPVMSDNGELVGVISTQKSLDDHYLDLLKDQTGQELIIFVNDKRSASTVLEGDELSRVENQPFAKKDLQYQEMEEKEGIAFAKVRILTVPYYASMLRFEDVDGEKIAEMVVGSPQEIVISSTQRALFNTFLLALGLCVLATIPSYYLSKTLVKNLSS